MAHLIGEMFYVGVVPWHHLGKRLTTRPGLDEAMRAGGLNWTVSTKPLALALAQEIPSYVPQRVAVVRDDRGAGEVGRVLGVVHPGYRLLQNRAGLEIFDELLGGGKYETGGYLRQGEVIWLQAALRKPIQVRKNDKLKTFLLFSNSHDGSRPIDIRLTTVRVVCNNTLSLATRSRELGTFFRRGHNLSLGALKDEAKAFFKQMLEEQTAQQEIIRKMSNTRCDDAAFGRFLATLVPDPKAPANLASNLALAQAYETRLQTAQAARAAIREIRKHGCRQRLTDQPVPPGDGSWWGALNAVTAWVDHVQTVEGSAYAHQLFGAGDTLKSLAYARIQAELTAPGR